MEQKYALLPTIFYRRRLPAIATFISVMFGALVYLIFAPRTYEAEARLMLDGKQLSLAGETGRDLTQESARLDSNPVATQAELTRSQKVLRQAIYEAYTAENRTGQAEKPPTVEELRKQLKVKTVPATSILEIKYSSKDPLITAKLLNALAEAMINEDTAVIRREAGSARQFLATEVPKKRAQLAQVEATLSQYKRTQGIVSLADDQGRDNAQTTSIVESLAQIEEQERTTLAQLQEAKARNSSLKQVTDSTTLQNTYAAVRSGQNEQLQELRTRLVELEAKLASAQSKYKADSPPLLNLIEERNSARALYQEKIASVSGNSAASTPTVANDKLSQDLATQLITGEVEASALEGRLAAIRRDRAALQERLNQLPIREQGLAALARQRQEAATSLEFLQRKLEEARIAEAQKVSNLRIVDLAEPPRLPTWPNPAIVLVLATVAGGVLALGTVLLQEGLDGTLRNATEAGQLVELPVLGVLPVISNQTKTNDRAAALMEEPGILESYRSLLKSLELAANEDIKVIVVSSALSGEGKSLVASYLAAVAATLSRKTLLIDADLRRPTQHQLFNLAVKPGLTEVAQGKLALAEAVQSTKIDKLKVLCSGKPRSHPSELFESKQIHNVIAAAAAQYDLVIVDTPPITSCVDAMSLSGKDEKLLLVARPSFTQRDIFTQAVTELTSKRVEVLGVAVNGIDPQIDKYYRYAFQGYKTLTNVS
jgi:capsular exopolysaccharide synthesis family protein